ncbi:MULTISPECIES: hypothetical protein [Mycobacterium]|uniref:Uncharacterized protein n=2 Tax=Mycobacterium TaxID=1763 RepID=A0A1Q4HP50_9MYCO|nr:MULTISPECIES: hypothetical protein [Mycobacterium]KEF94858.1 hypothetical protein K883_05282 [Mycobacterium sp. TKK-01-0059]OBK04909.1 hypothetical protein A9W96_14740 [Mycobacterium sp. 1245852.3]OCB23962.1 hypothetical protein A5689_14725 [Mycobacterium intracellulare subsp. yongonense]OJZ69481.1 hypothetical protein BRW65_22565 [Mycobacterium paraffinicum]
MPQPIRRTHAAVRSYCDQLRELMDQLRADPLNESKSVALVAHIINNRSTALQLLDVLENQAMGSVC